MREGKPEHTRFSARGFLIPAAIAAGITLALALLRGGTGNEDRVAAFAAWSDAFFAAGVFTGGAGLLSFASADGLFDVIRYGVGKVIHLSLSRKRQEEYPRTFFEYRSMKSRSRLAGGYAILTGAVCLVLAGLFLALS